VGNRAVCMVPRYKEMTLRPEADSIGLGVAPLVALDPAEYLGFVVVLCIESTRQFRGRTRAELVRGLQTPGLRRCVLRKERWGGRNPHARPRQRAVCVGSVCR